MINVVGLGKTGCLIAEKLHDMDEKYKPYKIGVDLPKTKNTRGIPRQKSHEKYEEKCPSLSYFFKQARGESLFFVDGSEEVSAASLRVLNAMDHKKTSVFYKIQEKFKKLVKKFHPDINSGDKKYEEKLKVITLAYTQLKNTYRKKIGK